MISREELASLGASPNGAVLSDDRVYRYALWRVWDPTFRCRLVVIGLNPSTADETTDDPTIRRCIGFAKREGCGGLVMLNLFAYRASFPSQMLRAPDPVGPLNDQFIRALAWQDVTIAVAAWGALGATRNRDRIVSEIVPALQCWGRTKFGMPRHPLYLRADTPLQPLQRGSLA